LSTSKCLVALGDIYGDGENRLIVLDNKSAQIKIFKGTYLETTKKLQGSPVCLEIFNPQSQKTRNDVI